MQAVIAIPAFTAVIGKQKTTELLMRPVAGVPLLKRIILTASRAEASDILLICPEALDHALSQKFSQEVFQSGSQIRVIQFWTRSLHFVHTYRKSGPFWFPTSTDSVTEVRVFGSTNLTINYFDYTPNPVQMHETASATVRGDLTQ